MEPSDGEIQNVSVISDAAIAALGEISWVLTVHRSKEHRDIVAKYNGSADALIDSLSDEQGEWFCNYQQMCAESLNVAERRRFVCGFKTAMRLALESMK